MTTETTLQGIADMAFNLLYDLPPDDRVIEATAGIEDAKAWLLELLKVAYKKGLDDGEAYTYAKRSARI